MKLFESLRFLKDSWIPIACLTGYNEDDARLLSKCGVDVILVGDSIGNVRKGYPDTTYVCLEDMVSAAYEVVKHSEIPVIVDMPINTYVDMDSALSNAQKIMMSGCDAVKVEGGVGIAEVAAYLVENDIEVVGHIGHTPQTDKNHRIRGRNDGELKCLMDDAGALTDAGVAAYVIELCDSFVASEITESFSTPSIGIGAGAGTDGQVLVLDDLLGWSDFSGFPGGVAPKFIGSRWRGLTPAEAVKRYVEDVKAGDYPCDTESFYVYEKN